MPLMTGKWSEKASGQRFLRSVPFLTLLVFSALGIPAQPAAAQSLHGCERLEQSPTPAVEGFDGMFFRIDPDLLMDTRLSDATIDKLGDLSRALASRGTTLIYVPVPTKGMVHFDKLGDQAVRYGYDARLARALYLDTVARLRAEGLATTDAVAALSAGSMEEPLFFGTDPRMTNEGLRLLARAAAREAGDDFRGTESFATAQGDEVVLDSLDRFFLQLSCQAELPEVRSTTFTTQPTGTGLPDKESGDMIVVGSTITGGPDRNFNGFLEEALGRRVTQDVIAGNAHDAMASYLTSDSYTLEAPDLIVWLAPIWENPMHFGDRPFRELVAAAAGDCGPGLPVSQEADRAYRIEMPGAVQVENASLRLDMGDATLTRAVFRFVSPEGTERHRSVIRQDPETVSSRAYMPLSGLWPEGVASVVIELDGPSEATPQVSVCRG